MATLKLVKRYPDGGATYGLDGVRGVLSAKKSMFSGELPETLEIDYDGFAKPSEKPVRSGGARAKDPAFIARTVEKAQKAQARLEKMQARAQKLAEQAARLQGGAASPGVTPAIEEAFPTEAEPAAVAE
jgi:hypothetical protein